MNRYECGFAAVNNGKHCVINGHCVVCKEKENMSIDDMWPEIINQKPRMITLRITEGERLRLLFELNSSREVCENDPENFGDDLDEINLLIAKLQDNDHSQYN